MDQVWFVAALWLFLALLAVPVAGWLKISTALSEIVVGTAAQLAIGALAGREALGATRRLPRQVERVVGCGTGGLLRILSRSSHDGSSTATAVAYRNWRRNTCCFYPPAR